MADTLQESVGVTNPLTLVHAMIDKGMDPDTIRRMMDLSERWEANRALKAFNAAMLKAQMEMPIVARDAEHSNKKGVFYARLETIAKQVKPVCLRNGFTMSFAEEECPKEGYGRVICDLRHIGGHEKRYMGEFPQDGAGAKGGGVMSPIQGKVSTYTYARKCLTCSIWDLVIADTDEDGNPNYNCVTLEQMQQLDAMIVDTKTNREKFLAWVSERCKTETLTLDKVPEGVFPEAMRMLKEKKARAT